jgi:dTDP-4-dehydrorhamnose reductase
MKLIITGASGYVATELVRQSLFLPQITTVIALARRQVSAPDSLGPGADASKLTSIIVQEYDEYPEDVKKHFADADACIW